MDKKELAQEIGNVYEQIQGLNVQPTKGNMTIMLNAMSVMEKVYQYLMTEETDPEKKNEE